MNLIDERLGKLGRHREGFDQRGNGISGDTRWIDGLIFKISNQPGYNVANEGFPLVDNDLAEASGDVLIGHCPALVLSKRADNREFERLVKLPGEPLCDLGARNSAAKMVHQYSKGELGWAATAIPPRRIRLGCDS